MIIFNYCAVLYYILFNYYDFMDTVMTLKKKTMVLPLIGSIFLLSIISTNDLSFAENERLCDDKITDMVASNMAKYDKSEINSKVNDNQLFTDTYSDEELRNGGIAFYGETDKENCSATITHINNQYVIEKDGEKTRIVVSLDPKTLDILEINEMKDRAVEASSQGINYGTYGGWAVRDDAGQSNSNIDEIKAYWTVPTITDPSGLNCGTTGTTACNFAVWAGQTDAYDGNDMIAQAITNSHCAGTNCVSTEAYDGLLQFWDNGSAEVDILCDVDPNPTVDFDENDDVFAKVKYYAITDQYTLYLENETDNVYCSTAHTETFELPRYGQFQAERPRYSGTPTNLGQVTDFYLEGYFWDNGSMKGLDDLDGTGYDWYEHKIGTGSTDIWVEPGTPRSTDDYLIDYQSST